MIHHQTTDPQPGCELDAEVAEKVMGWTRDGDGMRDPRGRLYSLRHGAVRGFRIADYSTDIAAAWLVVERMWERGWGTNIYRSPDGWGALFVLDHSVDADELAPTAPHAICLAALAAVEKEAGGDE